MIIIRAEHIIHEMHLNNSNMYYSYIGTILASSRGGFHLDVIINFLKKHKISHLYVIGGDGTHRLVLTIK